MSKYNFDNIPQEVKEKALFCLWTYSSTKTKIPIDPHTLKFGNSADKTKFDKFENVVNKTNDKYGLGIGVFNNMSAIDIDHVVDENGEINEKAQDIIDKINSYTEFSPSGTGIRILLKCNDGFSYDKEKYYIKHDDLEIYVSGMTKRFLTVTGNYICGEFRNGQRELEFILDKYMRRKRTTKTPSHNHKVITNENYLEIGLKNDEKLKELWNAEPSGYGGNESETDLALCNKLAFWCNKDYDKMYNAFMSSPYVRKKDNDHIKKLERDDYLQMTINKAITHCDNTAYEKYGKDEEKEKNDIVTVPDFEKDDYIKGDKPFEWLYQFKDNQFLMAQLREQVKEKAGKVGVKNFITLWNAFLLLKNSNKIVSENSTDFTGQPFSFDCGDYMANDLGIKTFDKYGFEINVCNQPLLPIERMINIDNGEERLKLIFRRGNFWKTIVVAKDILASANKIVELSKQGLMVTSENAKYIVKYLSEIEHLNYDKIPEQNSVSRLGWVGEHGFSPYVDNLTFDGELSFKHLFESVKQRGNYEKWIDTVKEVRKYNKIARIMLASSFSSVLLEICGCLPFFVHVWGGTEAGKSVGLRLAASVWANSRMGEYITTFNSTNVALELQAGFLNSMPFCIDELQMQANEKQGFDKIIYQLTEGIGKSRGAKTGGLQKLATWKNCIITNGEMPILSTNSGGGAINRLIQIDCKDEKLFENPSQLCKILDNHFGYAGRDFVEKIKDEETRDYIRELQQRFYKRFVENGATEKQSTSASVILTADSLINQWIFHDDILLQVEDLIPYLYTRDDVSSNKNAYEWIKDFVASNMNNFKTNYYGEYVKECWGKVEEETEENVQKIFIIRTILEKNMKENGYNTQSFLSWAKRNGLLETDEGRLTKKKRIQNIRTNCICVLYKND